MAEYAYLVALLILVYLVFRQPAVSPIITGLGQWVSQQIRILQGQPQ